jgi:two-component system nitrogen regulation sensor histidine kinase NtrY
MAAVFRRPHRISRLDSKERSKRRREMALVVAAVVLVVALTWAELRFLGVNSYLFLALFNINLILLIVVLFVVGRNVVKLLLERRRRVLGSGLRAKLVGVFMLLSFVPTLVMFLLSVRFVQTSIDYWFRAQVETSMEQALSVGQTAYSQMRAQLERQAAFLAQDLQNHRREGQALEEWLARKREEYGLSLCGILGPDRFRQVWIAAPEWGKRWAELEPEVPWAELEPGRLWVGTKRGKHADVLGGVWARPGGRDGFLVLGISVEPGLMARLDQVGQGVGEYRQLQNLKYPLKITLYLVLALMSLLVLLGALWFGFRLAREISAPVQALAQATERIAQGDLSVRIQDDSRDELGLLVHSFNRMAEDLEASHARVSAANEQLARQYMALEAQNRYIQAILDNVTAGVLSLDSQGRVVTLNPAAERILGRDAESARGVSVLEVLGEEQRGAIEEARRVLRGSLGSQWQRRMQVQTPVGPLRLLVTAVSIMDAQGGDGGVVVVFEDISELEKMQRLDAWKEVARRIAHEIKNPLTPIKLSAQRLERKFGFEVDDPEVFSQCTGLIVRQVEALQAMVTEFSAFAKLPEIQIQEMDLPPVVQETVEVFRGSHPHIGWECVAAPVRPILGDPEALRRVFFNLVLNAAEALSEIEDPRVQVRIYAARQRVCVDVADNGPGIDPGEQERVFEPYYSTKRGGTGLGLAIVKSLVTEHHGRVSVRPARPRGTIFTVELPVARRAGGRA